VASYLAFPDFGARNGVRTSGLPRSRCYRLDPNGTVGESHFEVRAGLRRLDVVASIEQRHANVHFPEPLVEVHREVLYESRVRKRVERSPEML